MTQSRTRRQRAAIDGVLLLDKPAGWSSNDALTRAKRILNAKKAGHTGTLDPFATGLLPLCFGEATKFSQDLLDADKTYETVVRLGVTTTTGDTEGDVVERREVAISRQQIEDALCRFRGEIEQVPPMHSALKRDGRPLYEYARAGIELEREARKVVIHALEMLDYREPFLTLRVTCSKGTYIRVLGEDIGKALGCGAHLQELRRTHVGELSVEKAHALGQLEQTGEGEPERMLEPVDRLLSSFPAISLTGEQARRFLHGQRLSVIRDGIAVPKQEGRVRIYRAEDGVLLGTAILTSHGVLAPERVIAART